MIDHGVRTFRGRDRIAGVLLVCLGLAVAAHSQQSGPAPSDSEAGSGGSAVPQQVLAELDAMKKRIAELEAQLKNQASEQLHGQTVIAVVPAKALTDPAPHAAAMQAEPAPAQKPAKAEPFAFADWTWLNGNPSTKDVVFDSKFFTPEVRWMWPITTTSTIPKMTPLADRAKCFARMKSD